MLSSVFVGLLSSRNSTIAKKQEMKSDRVKQLSHFILSKIIKIIKGYSQNKVVDFESARMTKSASHFQNSQLIILASYLSISLSEQGENYFLCLANWVRRKQMINSN